MLFPHKNNRPAYVIYVLHILAFDSFVSLVLISCRLSPTLDTQLYKLTPKTDWANREENWAKKKKEKERNIERETNRKTNINETAQIETMC